jgi:hypothetical protein
MVTTTEHNQPASSFAAQFMVLRFRHCQYGEEQKREHNNRGARGDLSNVVIS